MQLERRSTERAIAGLGRIVDPSQREHSHSILAWGVLFTSATMAIIETKYFGAMSYDEESCFEFPDGIPAFEDERRFLPLEMPDHKPLIFLQSTKTPTLCFVTLPILVADPAYKLAVSPEDLETLGFAFRRQPRIGSEALVLALLSIRDDGPATANLLAPVVINLSNRRGVQAIRHDSAYSHERPLAPRTEECAC